MKSIPSSSRILSGSWGSNGLLLFILAGLLMRSAMSGESGQVSVMQSRDDAWWTGPLLASSAATLPQGHLLVEPYLYDSILVGRFGADGHRSAESHEATVGSLAYFIYGVTDRISVGVIPKLAYRDSPGPGGSSGFGIGDVTVQAQYRLTQFTEQRPVPTISVLLSETLPSGKYDRLEADSGAAMGGGAYTTTLALYSQYYFWLSSGRILRSRLNIGYAWSSSVALTGDSVYGTPYGFSGRARPGNSVNFDAAFEYSVTRNWVLAIDILGEHDGNTHTQGSVVAAPSANYLVDSRSSEQLVFAPAVEFNWNVHVGVIVGTRIVGVGRNANQTIAAVAALNMVF